MYPNFTQIDESLPGYLGFTDSFTKMLAEILKNFPIQKMDFSASCTTEVLYSLIGKQTVSFKSFRIFPDQIFHIRTASLKTKPKRTVKYPAQSKAFIPVRGFCPGQDKDLSKGGGIRLQHVKYARKIN